VARYAPDADSEAAGHAESALEAGRAAFIDFASREYQGVILFLRHYGALQPEAQDAAQEAFIEAWKLASVPGGWERIKQPRAWIREVARRKLLRPPGPRRRIQTSPVADVAAVAGNASVSDHANAVILSELATIILRDLDEDTRHVMAYVIDEFEPREIAAELGMTTERVYDLKKKGRRALRAGLVVAPREIDKGDM
jgi:RNA polymerase sigma factor (sigma-70 family)